MTLKNNWVIVIKDAQLLVNSSEPDESSSESESDLSDVTIADSLNETFG